MKTSLNLFKTSAINRVGQCIQNNLTFIKSTSYLGFSYDGGNGLSRQLNVDVTFPKREVYYDVAPISLIDPEACITLNAAIAAPYPLSILQTVTPGAHETRQAVKAVSPSREAP